MATIGRMTILEQIRALVEQYGTDAGLLVEKTRNGVVQVRISFGRTEAERSLDENCSFLRFAEGYDYEGGVELALDSCVESLRRKLRERTPRYLTPEEIRTKLGLKDPAVFSRIYRPEHPRQSGRTTATILKVLEAMYGDPAATGLTCPPGERYRSLVVVTGVHQDRKNLIREIRQYMHLLGPIPCPTSDRGGGTWQSDSTGIRADFLHPRFNLFVITATSLSDMRGYSELTFLLEHRYSETEIERLVKQIARLQERVAILHHAPPTLTLDTLLGP